MQDIRILSLLVKDKLKESYISVTATQVLNVKNAFPPYNIVEYKPSILNWWLAQVYKDKKYRSDTLASFILSNRSSSQKNSNPFKQVKISSCRKKVRNKILTESNFKVWTRCKSLDQCIQIFPNTKRENFKR